MVAEFGAKFEDAWAGELGWRPLLRPLFVNGRSDKCLDGCSLE